VGGEFGSPGLDWEGTSGIQGSGNIKEFQVLRPREVSMDTGRVGALGTARQRRVAKSLSY
jgi:hypothetical protein